MFRLFRLRASVDDHIQQYICTLTTDTLVSRYRWSTTSMTDTPKAGCRSSTNRSTVIYKRPPTPATKEGKQYFLTLYDGLQLDETPSCPTKNSV